MAAPRDGRAVVPWEALARGGFVHHLAEGVGAARAGVAQLRYETKLRLRNVFCEFVDDFGVELVVEACRLSLHVDLTKCPRTRDKYYKHLYNWLPNCSVFTRNI
mgnify:CR=1